MGSNTPRSPAPDGLSSIAQSLKETTKLLAKVAQRMDKVDEKIGEIEQKINKQDAGITPSTPSRARSKVVPTEVRVRLTLLLHGYIPYFFYVA